MPLLLLQFVNQTFRKLLSCLTFLWALTDSHTSSVRMSYKPVQALADVDTTDGSTHQALGTFAGRFACRAARTELFVRRTSWWSNRWSYIVKNIERECKSIKEKTEQKLSMDVFALAKYRNLPAVWLKVHVAAAQIRQSWTYWHGLTSLHQRIWAYVHCVLMIRIIAELNRSN